MEFETTRINDANVVISAKITKEIINKNLDNIAKELSKTVEVAGFRKGKVPIRVIKSKFNKRLIKDAEFESVQQLLQLGKEKLNINDNSIILEPTLKKTKTDDGLLDVEIKISLRPKINLTNYKDLVPVIPKIEISEEEIDKEVNRFLLQYVPTIEVFRPIQNGDFVDMEYGDFEDFEDDNPQNKSNRNIVIQIGSGAIPQDLDNQLIGLQKGEVTKLMFFMSDKELFETNTGAGQKIPLHVKINSVNVKEPLELTDKIVKELINEPLIKTVEDLRENRRATLQHSKLIHMVDKEMKPKLMETLLATYDFDLPESVVEKEIYSILQQEISQFSKKEIEQFSKTLKDSDFIKTKIRPKAEHSVKATFLIDALCQAENIQVNDNEVKEFIYHEASLSKDDPEENLQQYKDAGYLPLIKMGLLEDKVLIKLLKEKFNMDNN